MLDFGIGINDAGFYNMIPNGGKRDVMILDAGCLFLDSGCLPACGGLDARFWMTRFWILECGFWMDYELKVERLKGSRFNVQG